MRELLGAAVAVMLVGIAATAQAAPLAEIRDAALRVTVAPEARPDVAVTVVKTNPRLPIWITREGDRLVVRGDVAHFLSGCGRWAARPGVNVWMRGRFGYDDLPQIVIHTPPDVRIVVGDAVFGAIGHARSVDLRNRGCGDWMIGDVDGRLRVALAGSGNVRAASAGSGDVAIAGSGDVTARSVRGGLSTAISGSGDFSAAAASGPVTVRVTGSGDVKIPGGQVTVLRVAVAGSGDVRFGGVARALDASVVGSGDVHVARVTGSVTKHVAGSGDVYVGR